MRPGTIPTALLGFAAPLAAAAAVYAATHDVSCQGIDPGTGSRTGGYGGIGDEVVFGGGAFAFALAVAASIGFLVARRRLRGRTIAAGIAASVVIALVTGVVWLFAGLASAFSCGFF